MRRWGLARAAPSLRLPHLHLSLSPREAALLYHTALGCADESASETEQLEKLLWYYPEADLSAARLTRLNLCEARAALSTLLSLSLCASLSSSSQAFCQRLS